MRRGRRGVIRVLAGPNGGGKSSIGGASLRARGSNYYNPDEVAHEILSTGAVDSLPEANSLAWKRGVEELRCAIDRRTNLAFETTLGGNTIQALLSEAADNGLEVHIWFVCLKSPELHIERVRARVAEGGHDIADEKIRSRYNSSRENLIHLLPKLARLHLYDNTATPDPDTGIVEPRLILNMKAGRIVEAPDDVEVPDWASGILHAALALRPTA